MEQEERSETIDLIANLDQCEEECLSGIRHSLEEGGDFVKKEHMVWMMDCADICDLAKRFVLRDSEYAGDILNLCSLICEDCAESCSNYFNDEHMVNCAKVCRNCAAVCRDAIDLGDEEEEEKMQDLEEDESDAEERAEAEEKENK